MDCPKCESSTRVVSVNRRRLEEVRRYRKCPACNHNFVTTQGPEILADKMQCLHRKGEDNHNSKLTKRKVQEMRAYAAEGASSYECAYVWDVSQKVAYNAIVGKTWKHVA